MKTEEFQQIIRRHLALKEYSQAFHLCLSCIFDAGLKEEAAETAKRLIKDYGCEIMTAEGGKRTLTVPLALSLDWIIDIAISLGYRTLEKGSISMGLFSSCPSVIVGSLMAKQKFGIRLNKDGNTTLLYTSGSFASDYKLIKALCTDIIEQLTIHPLSPPSF